MKKLLDGDNGQGGGGSDNDGPDFAFWKTRDPKGSWPAVIASRSAPGIAVIGSFTTLCFVCTRCIGACSNLTTQGAMVAIAIAILASAVAIVAVVKERNHGPGSQKPPDSTPKRRNVKGRTRKT